MSSRKEYQISDAPYWDKAYWQRSALFPDLKIGASHDLPLVLASGLLNPIISGALAQYTA